MKPNAYSLHIGLNRVDPLAYGGWGGQLRGCHNDATAMLDMAVANGFNKSSLLLSEEATLQNVSLGIYELAKLATPGDLVFITYSGHGGQVPDTNKDEPDGLDETWVLYDGMWLDDNLNSFLAEFAKGVRVVLLSDSCHSGTVIKAVHGINQIRIIETMDGAPQTVMYCKAAPQYACRAYAANPKPMVYPAKKKRVKSSVILISGCADNQYSYDLEKNGMFTKVLLETLAAGVDKPGYSALRKAIVKQMVPQQTPQITYLGARNKQFEFSTPFKP